ncbi:RdgB/HAM1 family non-canonical purine NTP pyrophosphatase [Aridibaculum aurantiacum]|uniref:RdgB/HAM1 family non-canonical purine NTP pyrophosphatase n=1 Tax=Aridibaculum aurantiacum TaxID=2810307 RepID=UPI001A972576|nr:RdgB/HAM1 family non-canonical purine NTP pyrophosphatase [Aridibaculum aurantiacum]
MRTIIFATNNSNKIYEVENLVGDLYNVLSLKAAGIDIDIPEPHATLEANAREKSETIYRLTGKDCFSEDTGLEVAALRGEPGVRSARYAGENKSSADNIEKVLRLLNGQANRKARFRTIVSLIMDGKEHQFEGICEGKIIEQPRGDAGFGYDPIFVPDGAEMTFAEMSLQEKNTYSHRKKAIAQLLAYLSLHGN